MRDVERIGGAVKRPITVKSLLDDRIMRRARRADHVIQVTWGCDCARRVLRYFESAYPNDPRPRNAIDAGRRWVKTGRFSMSVIRSAALGAHAAARAAPPYSAARSAARAAGQAVAAAHSGLHAIAAAIYAATAIRDAVLAERAEAAVLKERAWQYRRLVHLMQRKRPDTRKHKKPAGKRRSDSKW